MMPSQKVTNLNLKRGIGKNKKILYECMSIATVEKTIQKVFGPSQVLNLKWTFQDILLCSDSLRLKIPSTSHVEMCGCVSLHIYV
jgi:hypothetical protein